MGRTAVVLALAGLLALVGAAPVLAEGETVRIVSADCRQVTVRGGGYTPGQTLLILARAPQGEGVLASAEVKATVPDGHAPTTTLTFGGQVPDGTYEAVITTPGPGMKEEVVERFSLQGCVGGPAPGTDTLPFTGPGPHTPALAAAGLALLAAGLLILLRTRPAR